MRLYIDPGTGSMLFTILIGVLGALIYALRNVLVKARFLFSGGKGAKADDHEYPYVIFTDSKRYWNVFEPICDEMEKRGEKVLYLTASEDDPALKKTYTNIKTEFAGTGNRAFARMNMIKADLVLSSTPGLDVYQWKRSRDVKKYVHIPHGIYDLTLYRMFGLDYYDTILLTGPFQEEALRKLEQMRNLPAKEMPVVGLPYLDTMMKRYEKDGKPAHEKPIVLLAPSWGPSAILSRYGEKIIDALLKTDYQIIIRPHPQSFESEEELMDRLTQKYPNSDRLEWDRSNDNYETLRKSDILISDFSGVLFDFSFIFERPVIYADTSFDPSVYDADWLDEKPWMFSVMDRMGVQLTQDNVENIGPVIDEALRSEDLKAGREEARQEAWQHIGHSAEKTADYLIETRKKLSNG